MNNIFISFVLAMVMSFSCFAGGSVEVNCKLSPAGSFSITSDKLIGSLYRDGDTLKSKNMYVSVDTFKTGIELRDTHVKKHMNSKKIKMKNIVIKGSNGTGKLTVNKVSKKVKFNVAKSKTGYIATFSLKPSDYKMKKASFMGVGVVDEVDLKIILDKEKTSK